MAVECVNHFATRAGIELRHRAKFCGDRSNCCRDIAIFGFFKMAAAAILDFEFFSFFSFFHFFYFLTVGTVKRVELHQHANFCRNRLN